MRRPNALRAIALYVASGFLLSSLDATAKFLVMQDHPIGWVTWARYVGHLSIVIPFAWWKVGPGFWRTRNPGLQLLRSALLLGATVAFFAALRFLPLAEASAISFLAPLIAVVLARPVLGERVPAARWLAAGAGFAGILLVTRPGAAAFHPAALLMVGMALCNALYQLLTRKLAGEPVYTTLAYAASLGALLTTALLPFLPPLRLNGLLDALPLLGLGIFGGLGHACMIVALLEARGASQLTPFAYLQMTWPLAFGWLLFGQFPDPVSLGGIAIIVVAGLWLASQEHRRERSRTALPADR